MDRERPSNRSEVRRVDGMKKATILNWINKQKDGNGDYSGKNSSNNGRIGDEEEGENKISILTVFSMVIQFTSESNYHVFHVYRRLNYG